MLSGRFRLNEADRIAFIIWLDPRAVKVKEILCYGGLPERPREAHVGRSGFPHVGPASESSVFGHKINTFLTKLVWSRGMNIGLLRVHCPGIRLGS